MGNLSVDANGISETLFESANCRHFTGLPGGFTSALNGPFFNTQWMMQQYVVKAYFL
jgi:hypothetical protein